MQAENAIGHTIETDVPEPKQLPSQEILGQSDGVRVQLGDIFDRVAALGEKLVGPLLQEVTGEETTRDRGAGFQGELLTQQAKQLERLEQIRCALARIEAFI